MACCLRCLLLSGACLVLAANAAQSADLNATASVDVGWEEGPKQRGTLTLVWSCIVTIFACTWTVLHLNVPGLGDGFWTKVLRKAKWMAINILFPEFVFSKAVCDLRLALQELHEFDAELRRQKQLISWTVTRRDDLKIESHEWKWKVAYPWQAQVLYRLLGLELPPQVSVKAEAAGAAHADAQSPDRSPEGHAGSSSRNSIAPVNRSDAGRRPGAEGVSNAGHFKGSETENSGNSSPEVSVTNDSPSYVAAACCKAKAKEATEDGTAEGADAGISPANDADPVPESSNSPQLRGAPGHQQVVISWRSEQAWTVVHSYYAQMGGLVYANPYRETGGDPDYSVLTASKLTSRYSWQWPLAGHDHPLTGLVLSKKSIEDRSKADLLARSFAVLQTGWVILTVVVRAATRLPITQLEIATLAFAVFAVAIYAANWWKPKDVNEPTILQALCSGHTAAGGFERTESFLMRFSSPVYAQSWAEGRIRDVPRVANDIVWIEGNTPALFIMMALSSLVFGGLHCLAWNFSFPTHAELVCWRIVSVVSAVLPAVSLGASLLLNYVAFARVESQIVSAMQSALRPVEKLPAKWWNDMLESPAQLWGWRAQTAAPATYIDLAEWQGLPHFGADSPMAATNWNALDHMQMEIRNFIHLVKRFRDCWLEATLRGSGRPRRAGRKWYIAACLIRDNMDLKMLEFWRDYERYLYKRLDTPPIVAADVAFIDCALEAWRKAAAIAEREVRLKKLVTRASSMLTISTGIIYTVSRLIIVVLLFTSLRSVPEGVYSDTPWTRFLPNIS